jgi:hypothetical protein
METTCYQGKHNHFLRFLKFLGFGILGAIGITIFGFLFGYFVMLLWNWLMPAIFGLGLITFWQAVGLVILGRLLFGGFHHPRPPHKHTPHEMHSRCHDKHRDWKRWKYYGEYWKEKGEASFKEYVDQKEEPKTENPEA